MLFAITDIETTGRYAGANAITEIAIALHDGEKVIDTFQSLINPGTTIVPYVSRLTGITNEMVRNAPRFHEVAKKIWTMTEDAIFVAHSVNFDYTFIREEFKELGADWKRKKLCTVRLSRSVFPGHTSYGLGNICARLGIEINDRHRAMGDVQATVQLFERCLANGGMDYIEGASKRKSKESLLPPHLPRKDFEALPEKAGVYYFHDEHGKVIYVGKAINIKKRVYSHLTGKGTSRISFINAIAGISFELCGNELIALLKESEEIQRLFPMYNRMQKFDRGMYVLSSYVNQKGIRQLYFGKEHKHLQPAMYFSGFDSGREFISELVEEFELCPKYSGLQSTTGTCFHFGMGKCKGVCKGNETADDYNKRVEGALMKIHAMNESRVIVDEGRSYDERSVVLIENGKYIGFGFTNKSGEITLMEARDIVSPSRHSHDIMRILRMWENSRFAEEA